MKLIIDIPEEDYIRLRDEGMFGNVTTFKRAVREGIPLDQEPCVDAISRQAVLDLPRIKTHNHWGNVIKESVDIEDVRQLPPVTPAEKQQPCEDCISRQAVEDAIADMVVNGESLGYAVAYDILSDLPPVTPQPKMGHWIIVDKGLKVTSYKCSECGRTVRDDTGYDVIKDYPYCHCGAKMGGEQT